MRKVGVMVAAALCVTAFPAAAQQVESELIELHRDFVMTQMIERDPTFLLANSLPSYTVVAPGGVVESRDQIIDGLRAFAQLDSVTLTRERAIVSGDVALVLARQEVHGEILGPAAGLFGPVTSSTVFKLMESGAWMAVSRSITPCHPRAIEAGRC